MAAIDSLKKVWRSIPIVRPLFWATYRKCHSLCFSLMLYRLPNHDLTVDCLGMRVLVRNPRKSVIGRSIYLTGIWEKEFTEFLIPRLRAGMTVLDVGGDIGYFTLLFSKHVGPQGKVFVFEPVPKAKAYIDHNIALNHFDNASCLEFALSNAPGRVVLEVPFKKARISLTKVQADPGDIEVEMKVYDDWANEMQIGPIDLVKIDVEGAELLVLQGMQQTLRRYHPAIAVEIHPGQIRHFGHSAEELVAFLRSLDYRPTPVDKPEMVFDQGNVTVYWEKSA